MVVASKITEEECYKRKNVATKGITKIIINTENNRSTMKRRGRSSTKTTGRTTTKTTMKSKER